jgi:hypothetical protein
MKGTLISIFVGALAGALLALASSVHASHAASRAKAAASGLSSPGQVAEEPDSSSAVPPAAPSEHTNR